MGEVESAITLDKPREVVQKDLYQMMSERAELPGKFGLRLISVFLLLGGILGLISTAPHGLKVVRQADFARLPVAVLSLLVFLSAVWVGAGLWQVKPRAFIWAKVLLALQVPIVAVMGVIYEFSAGLSFRILLSGQLKLHAEPLEASRTLTLGGNLGSSLNLGTSLDSQRWMAGINIVALVALIYLLRADRRLGRSLAECGTPQAERS